MDAESGSEARERRGRVVMLVDNGVNGDSRVQKQARSMADAGWEVTLLGRAPEGRVASWRLGEADVRLIAMDAYLDMNPMYFRRAWLRKPFAYPPFHVSRHRTSQVAAWHASLRERRARLAVAGRTGGSKLRIAAAKAYLLLPRAGAFVAKRWVDFRRGQTEAMQRARRSQNTRLDRLVAKVQKGLRGDRAWRRLEPGLWDFELAYGPQIDRLKPDLIHANDFRMLSVGARAMMRARARGRDVKLVWDAHEFLPGIKPWKDTARWHPACVAMEREYAPYADAVVTVSETLAEMLQNDHKLPAKPTVVLNAPDAEIDPELAAEPVPDLRELCGISAGEPLIVYSGAAAPQRGLGIMVEALPQLDGVHSAFVVLRPESAYVQSLVARAKELGVADRVHVLPYVPHYQVTRFLAAADAGVIPIHHFLNHEIALITKFMEYSHARLPLVVSDVKTMGGVTEATGQGEVFRAEDLADFVRAVKSVLTDPDRYRSVYDKPGLLDEWTWEAQAAILDGLYSTLLGRPRTAGEAAAPAVPAVTGAQA
ncbi:glycosyltransferase family 4 protein [Actinacidiphila bryophytorum]|uniref:glycosyltransferase family 4 protein n=1 Tax=Actinacidiphila bryophytorum TaxID=1436133 RepID=UPI002176B0F3|nr:glycosyltransferase family 4 protein [Actinacidiphila bryophytorum]UWE08463.1 glycosyltransferase family 4 protein [Actinacidiphila bryophytorum]